MFGEGGRGGPVSTGTLVGSPQKKGAATEDISFGASKDPAKKVWAFKYFWPRLRGPPEALGRPHKAIRGPPRPWRTPGPNANQSKQKQKPKVVFKQSRLGDNIQEIVHLGIERPLPSWKPNQTR